MDQDSRTDESRERCLSSEPSSTRPNPFDDDDASNLSARKRRRTSLSGSLPGSPTASVVRRLSREPAVAASDINAMKIDTPEPTVPSTPDRPECPVHPVEPVSSRVTINLRNADSLEATPTSPASPSPSGQRRSAHVRASVEAPEVDMAPVHMADDDSSSSSTFGRPVDNASSSSSTFGSPEPVGTTAERVGEEAQFAARGPYYSYETADLNCIVSDFPYRYEGELPQDAVTRLTNYFRQHPANVDEGLLLVHNWLNRCLSSIRFELRNTALEAYRGNRCFWTLLPDLFLQLGHRMSFPKTNEIRDLITQSLAHFAKLVDFLLTIDNRSLSQGIATEENFAMLLSPHYLRVLSTFPHPEEAYSADGAERNLVSLDPFDVFQSSHGASLAAVVSFIEHHVAALPNYPRTIMENLVCCCYLVQAVVKRSYQTHVSWPTAGPQGIGESARQNLVLGHKCFNLISSAMETLMDKSINSLSQDNATSIIVPLSDILKHCLGGSHSEALQRVEQHGQEHPGVMRYTPEAIALEWRFELYCRLIRSPQMQLRVSAATSMSDDLVHQWKRHPEQQDHVEDPLSYLEFQRYLSGYITHTGIIDYILGPTCHPEITAISSNIIGFLGVTKTYTAAQTDLLWQTLTSTQDPRIPEALVKMMFRVTSLLQPMDLIFILEKFRQIPVGSFTPVMRDFFDNITELLMTSLIPQPVSTALFEVCVRLLRESSVFTAQGSIAYPDTYHFAQSKLRRLLTVPSSEEGRRGIVLSCLDDISSRSETSSGSLQVLTIFTASQSAIHELIREHNFIQLLVDDLEATVHSAKTMGVSSVYAHPLCQARRRFLSSIMTQFGSAIDTPLGQRLWNYLVGDQAISQDDRRVAWEDLQVAFKRKQADNHFIIDCERLFLPSLPPSCYCYGSLLFVKEAIVPIANDTNNITLDDEESLKSSGLELLWQIILAAPVQKIANMAISTLVNEIYVNSSVILSYPFQRARKVHFSLAHRCLLQLKAASTKLKALEDDTTNDDEPMVITDITDVDGVKPEQKLRFARTLQVLNTLSNALRTKSVFAAPDLRSLMLSSPNALEGEEANLKYQSFDGNEHTEMKPLRIGMKNSAASLLASLREATGFENYRLYFRGSIFSPSEVDVCKPLEELNMKSGLLLVKKELDSVSSPKRIKPGASPLEIEILSHFSDLWEYLSMEEDLARQIYEFLISLPADNSTLAAFESPATSPRDIFPLGQPFKSLYAIHALREYLNTWRLKSTMRTFSRPGITEKQLKNDQQDVVTKILALVTAAICDPDVVEQCSNQDLRLQLGLELVDTFVQLLKESPEPALLSQILTQGLYERLMAMLISGAKASGSKISVDLVHRCFEALLECCAKNDKIWILFRGQAMVGNVIQSLLLSDERPFIRRSIAKLITARSVYDSGQSGVPAIDFAEALWPIIFQLLPEAALKPQQCEELFSVASQLTKKLVDNQSNAIDLPSCVKRCGDLLLKHTSTEDIAHPETLDKVAHGLVHLLLQGIEKLSTVTTSNGLPLALPRRLFLKHLFPPESEIGPLVPRAIFHSSTRCALYDVVYTLAKDSRPKMTNVLQSLDRLLAHQVEEGGTESYQYELPQAFERTSAQRSICGYSGLRNLSNTCYLNSLFTQLFMNIGFRRFILGARIDRPHAQQLLAETQLLFANLQDSRRRFIDPQACVEQITTYDELPIDIHSQMDVDEFFNLLFDRWEAQFSFSSDKRALRSIYGGQLVQQVKSKECEHISERIEPFSAIQCDIKGKSSLEKSLQAYVDGEIMEGDNKYKCSTCDRHVDAVKRACLKDLPDNLIFHLKRFDFNLRLLQRNKINDYFPFPDKIDMQPYTVEHLKDPSRSAEPDTFELVGILVHSGTAETGHYYSYIRERPTSSGTSWVEFNDDTVTSWDPAQMEHACFGGGPDHRQYDHGDGGYEKVFSAYMLFYQRSSSLQQEQETLKATQSPKPLRVDTPPDLEMQVKLDNWAIMQRHNLYDPSHMAFVIKILEFTLAGECSEGHKEENLAMQVALGHLDQIASRAKDLPHFDALNAIIATACQQCSLCCFAFFDYFRVHKEAFRMLLFRNLDSSVRFDMGKNLIYVLKRLKDDCPEEYDCTDSDGDETGTSITSKPAIVESTADLFAHVWESFHTRPVAWPEYFGTMIDFVKLGRLEACALLDREFLVKIIMAIAADQNLDLPAQYSRLLAVVSRRIAATKAIDYDGIITLADSLMECMDTEMGNYVENSAVRVAMARHHATIPFNANEVNILHKTWGRADTGVFLDKLIQLNQNPIATDSIISRLATTNTRMDHLVLRTLSSGATGHITPQPVTPYLHASLNYCVSSSNKDGVHKLIRHITEQCMSVQNAEGKEFYEFQRSLFDAGRNTGENRNDVQLHGLRVLPLWVPGLLGYPDRSVSGLVESFLQEKLFKYGPTPAFETSNGGPIRSQVMMEAGKELAVRILYYLKETYVERMAQVSRDMMQPFYRTLHKCGLYFGEDNDADDTTGTKFKELNPGAKSPFRSPLYTWKFRS
ncbi:hypothetical protein F4808DRAFT_151120 [Astrocystis sublimbata]|nr:hypothetical protein F4808DRAFT_151120 [Astrocystis sublimbata]